ncbi:MAG: TA0956 family protein [Thermoplasmataceae archaeon]
MMYNISLGDFHPSTICVELSKLESSLREVSELLVSEYPQDSVSEFIEKFARTSQIMPEDKTIGFIVVNKKKMTISISATKISSDLKARIAPIVNGYSERGINAEFDVS